MGEGEDVSTLSFWFNVLDEQCDTAFDQNGGVAVYILLIVYTFYLLARLCDDFLMVALERICNRLGLTPDIAGATFLALASSAPEIFTSIVTTFVIVSAGGVGCIAGSAIFNLLVIIGSVALISKKELSIGWYPTVRDSLWNMLAMSELYIFILDGRVEVWECALMITTYAIFLLNMKRDGRIVAWLQKKGWYEPGEQEGQPENHSVTGGQPETVVSSAANESHNGLYRTAASAEMGLTGSKDGIDVGDVTLESGSAGKDAEESSEHGTARSTVADTADLTSHGGSSGNLSGLADTPSGSGRLEIKLSSRSLSNVLEDEDYSAAPKETTAMKVKEILCSPVLSVIEATMPKGEQRDFSLFLVCVFWITVITYLMVDTSNRLGCVINMPPVAFGLIFVAAGTSVPDTISSIAAARAGYGDMCCSNALGSTRINLTMGLGLPWILRALYTGQAITITDTGGLAESVVLFTICTMLYCCILGLCKWKLRKPVGTAMLAIFSSYVVWVFLRNYNVVSV